MADETYRGLLAPTTVTAAAYPPRLPIRRSDPDR